MWKGKLSLIWERSLTAFVWHWSCPQCGGTWIGHRPWAALSRSICIFHLIGIRNNWAGYKNKINMAPLQRSVGTYHKRMRHFIQYVLLIFDVVNVLAINNLFLLHCFYGVLVILIAFYPSNSHITKGTYTQAISLVKMHRLQWAIQSYLHPVRRRRLGR